MHEFLISLLFSMFSLFRRTGHVLDHSNDPPCTVNRVCVRDSVVKTYHSGYFSLFFSFSSSSLFFYRLFCIYFHECRFFFCAFSAFHLCSVFCFTATTNSIHTHSFTHTLRLLSQFSYFFSFFALKAYQIDRIDAFLVLQINKNPLTNSLFRPFTRSDFQ